MTPAPGGRGEAAAAASAGSDGSRRESRLMLLWLNVLARSQDIFFTGTAAGVLYYRNAHAVYFLGTSLATAFIAKGLKLVFKQPRPTGTKKTTYGMPSTHCATGTFACLYLAHLLTVIDEGSARPALLLDFRNILLPTLSLLPALVIYSRVRLRVHTLSQCMAGFALGCACVPFFVSLWPHVAFDGKLEEIIGNFRR